MHQSATREPRTTRHPRAIAVLAAAVLAALGAAPAAHAAVAAVELPDAPALGWSPRLDALGAQRVAVTPPAGAAFGTALTPGAASLWVWREGELPSGPVVTGLPVWAVPHLGTDAAGRRVVVYPRCSADRASACNLYAYDLESRTEQALSTVNASAAGELEGTMQGGAIAFTRSRPADAAAPIAEGAEPGRALLYRSVGGSTRRVSRRGGTSLALRGDRIAQNVILTDDGEFKQVELIRIGSRAVPLLKYHNGAGSRNATALRFTGPWLRFALGSLDGAHAMRASVARPGRHTSAPLRAAFSFAFATSDTLVSVRSARSDRAVVVTEPVPAKVR